MALTLDGMKAASRFLRHTAPLEQAPPCRVGFLEGVVGRPGVDTVPEGPAAILLSQPWPHLGSCCACKATSLITHLAPCFPTFWDGSDLPAHISFSWTQPCIIVELSVVGDDSHLTVHSFEGQPMPTHCARMAAAQIRSKDYR